MFTCNSCAIVLESLSEQKIHHRSDWHLYNTKRRVVGLDPITEETWFSRLEEIKTMQEQSKCIKGTGHIKKRSANTSERDKPVLCRSRAAVSDPILDELFCLFDGKKFQSVEENLNYMANSYSFFVPDISHVSDLIGLLKFLGEKLSEGHQCIYCDKVFSSLQAVRGHMLDSNHTGIGTSTDDLLDDIEDFYSYPDDNAQDAEGSTIDDSEERVAEIQDDGSLLLPSGNSLVHREYAYIYKQRLTGLVAQRSIKVSSPIDSRRAKYLAILGGSGRSGGGSTGLVSSSLKFSSAIEQSQPTYVLKRMAKKVQKEIRECENRRIRLEMKSHRTQMFKHYKNHIVEMYTFA